MRATLKRARGRAGLLLVAGLGLVLSGGSAEAYSRLLSQTDQPIFWPAGQRPVSFVSATGFLPPGISASDMDGAVRRAFQTWDEDPGHSLDFVEITDPAQKARDDFDAVDSHLVLFEPDAFAGVLAGTGTVAVAMIDVADSGEILDADIMISRAPLNGPITAGPGGGYDLQNVLTREVGHLLGLGASADLGATMLPQIELNSTTLRSLSADDRAGISEIYPPAVETRGFLQGRITTGGAGLFGAHVVAYESDTGRGSTAAISDPSGFFTLRGLDLRKEYFVYAEPLDGPVGINSFRNGRSFVTQMGCEFFGGFPPTQSFAPGVIGNPTLIGTLDVDLNPEFSIRVATPTVFSANTTTTVTLFADSIQSTDQFSASHPGITITPNQVMNPGFTMEVSVAANVPPGLYHLFIHRPLTGEVDTLTGAFEIAAPAPRLDAINPAVLSQSSLSQVTGILSGDQFLPGAKALIGSTIVDLFTVNGQTATFGFPQLPVGSYDVRIENPDGQFDLLRQAFTVISDTPPPPPPPPPPPTPPPPPPAIAPASGGGGGGGGCDMAPRQGDAVEGALGSLAPLALLLLLLLGLRRARP